MVWKFVNAAGGLVAGLDGEVSVCRSLFPLQPCIIKAQDELGDHCYRRSPRQGADNKLLQDELKLLRVRTKKQELVIVPDVKYLLIVIHETPAA